MKVKEVRVGSSYLTKIGEDKNCEVVVLEEVLISGYMQPRFRVRRAGERNHLPKARHASALRNLNDRK